MLRSNEPNLCIYKTDFLARRIVGRFHPVALFRVDIPLSALFQLDYLWRFLFFPLSRASVPINGRRHTEMEADDCGNGMSSGVAEMQTTKLIKLRLSEECQ